jgi:hypothetical protein
MSHLLLLLFGNYNGANTARNLNAMNSACTQAKIDCLPAQKKKAILEELAREFGFILHPATHTLHLFKKRYLIGRVRD